MIGVTKTSLKHETIPFVKESLVLIVPPNHPLAKREIVSLRELEGYPFIIRAKGSTTRKIVLEAFKDLNIHPSLSKYAIIPPSFAGGMNGLPSPLGGA
ncbi:MAG: hypothetical protein A2157_20070 [Deltaproteobacteria bacterium RBG_16_47_11]|nr:MAG: hypothetical protein A2157_20070 [Deltaproteobacteria bacterium RBG_16_47_11]